MTNKITLLFLLIALGSCASIRDQEPLHFALYDRDYVRFKSLVSRPENAIEKKGILYSAVLMNNVEMIEYLLENKLVDPNYINLNHENSPLMFAIAKKNIESIMLLLGHGADPNYKTSNGSSAIAIAMNSNQNAFYLTKILIEHGAAVSHNMGFLAEAAARGDINLISLLLSKNLSVDDLTPRGDTPLLWASVKGQMSAVNILLKNKANIEATSNGFTSAELAMYNNRPDIADLIKPEFSKRWRPKQAPLSSQAARQESDTSGFWTWTSVLVNAFSVYTQVKYPTQYRGAIHPTQDPQPPANYPQTQLESQKTNVGVNSEVSTYQAPSQESCSSDYACGMGFKCVKEPFTNTGVCLKSVNNSGIQIFKSPDPDSLKVKIEGACQFDFDCSSGFRCDSKLKACTR